MPISGPLKEKTHTVFPLATASCSFFLYSRFLSNIYRASLWFSISIPCLFSHDPVFAALIESYPPRIQLLHVKKYLNVSFLGLVLFLFHHILQKFDFSFLFHWEECAISLTCWSSINLYDLRYKSSLNVPQRLSKRGSIIKQSICTLLNGEYLGFHDDLKSHVFLSQKTWMRSLVVHACSLYDKQLFFSLPLALFT